MTDQFVTSRLYYNGKFPTLMLISKYCFSSVFAVAITGLKKGSQIIKKVANTLMGLMSPTGELILRYITKYQQERTCIKITKEKFKGNGDEKKLKGVNL